MMEEENRPEIERLARARAILEKRDLSAQLVTDPVNVRHLSGYTGTAAWMLVEEEKAVLITDFRYEEQSRDQTAGTGIEVVIREKGYTESLRDLLGGNEKSRIGFDGDSVSVSQWERLTEDLPERDWVNTAEAVKSLRMVKDRSELAAIIASLAILESAFEGLFESGALAPGRTEREAAFRFEMIAREMGADTLAFEPIVASGPRGAMPHGVASERVMERGEAVVLDLGVVKNGYHSDMTRMVSLGEPRDQEVRRVWDILDRAVERVFAEARPGMKGQEIDRLAREMIEEAGYGPSFGHSLGHGVGLAIHEAPTVGPLSETALPEGTVFTVEPGIYLPGRFGLRLEEMAVLTKTGLERLNSLPRDLRVL